MDTWELRSLRDQAVEAARSGDHARALALTDRLVETEPALPGLASFRAQLLLEMREPQAALAEAQRAVELDPLSLPAYLAQARSATEMNHVAEAQLAYENAIRFSDREPDILVEFARFMSCHRGPRQGEVASRKALAAAPDAALAWASLGLAQFRQHHPLEAEQNLCQALKLDPNCAFAQATMVMVLQQKGDDARAVALADVLSETPGTEAFVAGVHREANRRSAMRKLYEREDVLKQMAQRQDRMSQWHGVWWLLVLLAVLGPVGFYAYEWIGLSLASLPALLAWWWFRA